MYKAYFGILYFEKFAGVKSGRSIWKEGHVKTMPYMMPELARDHLEYLRDTVAPAMGVKVRGYSIETMLCDEIPF